MDSQHSIDVEYFDKIKDICFNPIFILGLHRSGTSILYKILNETGGFNVLNTYHILNYDKLLYNHIKVIEEIKRKEINDYLKEKGITNRGTDHLKVNANYANEYCYIFSNKDLPVKLTNKNKELFDNLCKKLKYIYENDKPLLLKNPYDFSNFLFIKEKYPNAKFIFIHRNPIDVISSTIRLWRTILKNKNEHNALYSKHYAKIFQNPLKLYLLRKFYFSKYSALYIITIRHVSKILKYFLSNINKIPKEDYISVKYEDLCEKPNLVVNKIFNFLSLNCDQDIGKFIDVKDKKILPEIKNIQSDIYKKMKPYFKYFNYGLKEI